ncbi:DUF6114 domain-containing protein [Isoptericola sp. NEAU-Y5]|uniref:DUF6114 domain-containing protein n=1 Tax=Isoptericola luteus TaxID=2879484 RepID=A0ABS7ZJ31_9MICO|nr:DUF6114 domain-containing protein [Isoptericola sp. NEAU-Y5]MCA5895036.1 DUF6114 domain-containing protein [Isoptericola sp. NEAU-Y5]
MSDENTSTPRSSPDEPATRRQRFAAWRRGRPFWGGVLTVLAGLGLWFSGRLELDDIEIQLGIEGMQSTLLPVALVLLGVLLTTQPQFRVFYGVITLAISVYSLLGVNLGGFGVGMVLGVVGGILAVSWMPVGEQASASAPQRADDGADDGADVATPGHVERAAGPLPEPDEARTEVGVEDLLAPAEEPVRGGRHAAVVAAVAVLAVGGTGATAVETAGVVPAQVQSASSCWDPLGWLDWICGDDEDDAEATPSPSPSADDDPAEGDDAAADGETDDPRSSDAGEPDSGGADGEKSDGEKDGGEEADEADDTEPSEQQAQEEVTEAAALELGPCARITFGGEYDINVSLPGDCGTREDGNVFSLDGDLETRDLQLPLTGINGIDVVNVPVTNDGPRRDALRLSVDSVKVPGFWLKTYAYSGDSVGGTVTNADYVSMEGNAQMYISTIHANLPDGDDLVELGEKIAGGASLVEILLGLVDARIGLMGATSDVQVWSDFRETVWKQ